jgi:hypothetical protein
MRPPPETLGVGLAGRERGSVGGQGDHAALLQWCSHDERFAFEGGIKDFLDGDEEGVNVQVKNVPSRLPLRCRFLLYVVSSECLGASSGR